MKSKAEVIRRVLRGKQVIDIGGSGYGEANRYEAELSEAWELVERRFIVDRAENADFRCDLNKLPLPSIPSVEHFEVTVALDVLEHLQHPLELLRWVPTRKLIVSLPNALSPIARRMGRGSAEHLYSSTPRTATNMLRRGHWRRMSITLPWANGRLRRGWSTLSARCVLGLQRRA